jgi:hypothetical protein
MFKQIMDGISDTTQTGVEVEARAPIAILIEPPTEAASTSLASFDSCASFEAPIQTHVPFSGAILRTALLALIVCRNRRN